MEESLAIARLKGLLGFVAELATLDQRDRVPRTELRATKGGPLVLHEQQLRKLVESAAPGEVPLLTLGGSGGAWLRLRRPTSEAARASALGKLASSAYEQLFTARQEGLREGRGAQLMIGIGIVRWAPRGSPHVDHPLVLIPAELQLAEDGALVVRMAEAASAELWLFPGVAAAAPALAEIHRCAMDYRLLGTLSPPPPTAREAWEPLLSRAAHCLASDGAYVATPPAARRTVPGATVQVHNSFTLFTREVEAGAVRTVAKDAGALALSLSALLHVK